MAVATRPAESTNTEIVSGFFQSVIKRMNPTTALNLNWACYVAGERRRKQMALHDVVIPQAMAISVTNRCNLSCPGCPVNPVDAGRRELSAEELRKIIRDSMDLGVYIFFILGGEPFVRNDLLDVITAEKDALFMVFTNGTLLNEKIVSTISEHTNILPMLSLEGFREATDHWRGAGIFDKVMNAMALLSQHGVFFGYSVTVTRLNYEEIGSERFVGAMYAAGCRVAYHSGYVAVGEQAPREYMLSVADRRVLRETVIEIARTYDIAFISENLETTCIGGGSEYLHISPYGDAEPCPAIHFSTHNIRKHTLIEVLKGRIMCDMRETAQSLAGAEETCVFRAGEHRRFCAQE